MLESPVLSSTARGFSYILSDLRARVVALPRAEPIFTGVYVFLFSYAPVDAVSATQRHGDGHIVGTIAIDCNIFFMIETAAKLRLCPIDRDADAQI